MKIMNPLHLSDEVINRLTDLALYQTESRNREWFEVDHYENGFYFNAEGDVVRERIDSGGDGLNTPIETITRTAIKWGLFECRDAEGDIIETDFKAD